MAASESLLKHEHPVVVNDNANKNSTKVSLSCFFFFQHLFNIQDKTNIVHIEIQNNAARLLLWLL